ncbi:MAG TPA: FMN-dependent NADH-azoreductase [Verrucomicrobiae bacterium]|nr:FMN-dependent NADH-azoreductase [Verrucomicrobiae bacterium]
MKKILIVEVSPRGESSASREVTKILLERLDAAFPAAKFIHRDLAKDKLPHLDDNTLKAIASKIPAEIEAHKQFVTQSDMLTAEFLDSDLVVIATPMWNFGIPSLLKAWIDLIVRPGKTFNYTEAGATGLAKGKKAILVLASGGVFSEGPWKSWDFVEPYLRQILKFVGIEDVQTIRIEGLNIPALAETAVLNAEKTLDKLAFKG